MLANEWVLVIIDWTILPHVLHFLVIIDWAILLLHFFTLQDVEPTNPWLRLGGEWICKAGRNHQRSSMVGYFYFQILILLHFAVLSFDTIQVNCLNTWYFFFSNSHPSSFCCSFFWHNPSKLPQVLSGWWDAGLQLSRLQRLRDHSGARLRQVPRQLKVFGWLYNFPPSDWKTMRGTHGGIPPPTSIHSINETFTWWYFLWRK